MPLALALLQWALVLMLRVPLMLAGLVVVPIALRWADWNARSVGDGRTIVNLPRWAWLWGNDYDGALGDKRGWWAANASAEVLFGLLPLLRRPRLEATGWLAMFWWLAIRNPVNNLRLVPGVSCPVAECEVVHWGDYLVKDKPGLGGWQFVQARRIGGRSCWFGFYFVHEWSPERAFVIRLGYKAEPRHEAEPEPAKGVTFKLNPWKLI